MPILSTLLAASAVAALPNACAWDDPGRDPFLGEVPAAVDAYADIPPDVRSRLKERMARHAYDDFVEIQRDTIEGTYGYEPEIAHMHFGSKGLRCVTTSRDGWKPSHREDGLVYCEAGHCILVPTVCRNVSRIVRRPDPPPPVGELEFEPPGAGPAEEPRPGVAVVPLGLVPPPPNVLPEGGSGSGRETSWPFESTPLGGGSPVEPSVPRPPLVATPVPEPETGLLALAGLAIVGWWHRRKARADQDRQDRPRRSRPTNT